MHDLPDVRKYWRLQTEYEARLALAMLEPDFQFEHLERARAFRVAQRQLGMLVEHIALSQPKPSMDVIWLD